MNEVSNYEKLVVLFVFGTRPEVIKMAPIIREMETRQEKFHPLVVVTGQHKEMSDPYLDLFRIKPNFNLSIMEDNQTLNDIVIKILERLPKLLKEIDPDLVLVQGDTSSAFAAALASYHKQIKVGHVEAGLRTGNKFNPFPEEMNRHLIAVLADLHFAPTERAKNNLLEEGIPSKIIFVTGNTVIDALLYIVDDNYKFNSDILKRLDFDKNKVICVTTHRRESFGRPLQNTMEALKQIVKIFPDVEIVLPVHYNPNVKKHVFNTLGHIDRIHLCTPLSYEPFVQLLNKSYLIITDSGGIQEEAPSLGKPVLVIRETTERPEGIEAGTAKLVGTDVDTIISEVKKLVESRASYDKMVNRINPYGDGTAACKIVDVLEETFLKR